MLDTSRASHTRSLGNTRVFYRAWYPEPSLAQILIDYRATLAGPPNLERAVELLKIYGFKGAVTGAIMPNEQFQFQELGFGVREELHVMSRSLKQLNYSTAFHSRRMKNRDAENVLRIDHESFSQDWQLDQQGIVDAKHATSHSRVRVVEGDGNAIGYAITGRTARNGYLQRLAVDSNARQSGVGTALVVDALRWLSRRRCEKVSVNTQLDNGAALALYDRLGFTFENYKLAILDCLWD